MVGLAPMARRWSLRWRRARRRSRASARAADGAQAEISEAGARSPARSARASGGRRLGADRRLWLRRRTGASLQAVRGHRARAILERPGETDLSAHVDFAALAAAPTRRPSGRSRKPTSCSGSGLLQRAKTLKTHASAEQCAAIDAALARLIDPAQMGTLFRVLAVTDGRSTTPAGFSEAA
jgi:NADH dehydrogenase [ubiquinone] 1 alpha subcomplex assembly factor 7